MNSSSATSLTCESSQQWLHVARDGRASYFKAVRLMLASSNVTQVDSIQYVRLRRDFTIVVELKTNQEMAS